MPEYRHTPRYQLLARDPNQPGRVDTPRAAYLDLHMPLNGRFLSRLQTQLDNETDPLARKAIKDEIYELIGRVLAAR